MIDVLKFILFDENVIDQDWLWKKKKNQYEKRCFKFILFL